EEHVAEAGVQGGRAGKQRVGERIPDAPEAQVVDRALVAELIDCLHHAALVLRVERQPAERGGHEASLTLLSLVSGRTDRQTVHECRHGPLRLLKEFTTGVGGQDGSRGGGVRGCRAIRMRRTSSVPGTCSGSCWKPSAYGRSLSGA